MDLRRQGRVAARAVPRFTARQASAVSFVHDMMSSRAELRVFEIGAVGSAERDERAG